MIERIVNMATNAGEHRDGSVKDRVQRQNKNGEWEKIDTTTGKVIDTKEGEPFKGVAHVDDGRRKD